MQGDIVRHTVTNEPLTFVAGDNEMFTGLNAQNKDVKRYCRDYDLSYLDNYRSEHERSVAFQEAGDPGPDGGPEAA